MRRNGIRQRLNNQIEIDVYRDLLSMTFGQKERNE